MQQFSIYQTTQELLLKAIILLVEKCYHGNLKSVVLVADSEQQELLNKTLWTYSRRQFIPHGSKLDPMPEKQPIYITDELQNPNDAGVLLIISPKDIEKILQDKEYISRFQRIIIIYDLPIDLQSLVLSINKLTVAEKLIDCYKQNPNGSWEKVDI
ncbi:DNA polymerase III subunit chi [Rickettsia endosymbiont of Polydrusus tereticollis]|uniref:DNA polymerase III subunit chi n=1 Tax=Rickettsia endosymbiont of Polydrusus tereticollis TaxID=3066251 RepID=UPI003132F82E